MTKPVERLVCIVQDRPGDPNAQKAFERATVAAQGDGEIGTSFDAALRGSDGLSWTDGALPQARSNYAEMRDRTGANFLLSIGTVNTETTRHYTTTTHNATPGA